MSQNYRFVVFSPRNNRKTTNCTMAQISQHKILLLFCLEELVLGIIILRACPIKPYNVVQKQRSPIFMNFCGQVTLYPSIANRKIAGGTLMIKSI